VDKAIPQRKARAKSLGVVEVFIIPSMVKTWLLSEGQAKEPLAKLRL
jgi:hypothetical protein